MHLPRKSSRRHRELDEAAKILPWVTFWSLDVASKVLLVLHLVVGNLGRDQRRINELISPQSSTGWQKDSREWPRTFKWKQHWRKLPRAGWSVHRNDTGWCCELVEQQLSEVCVSCARIAIGWVSYGVCLIPEPWVKNILIPLTYQDGWVFFQACHRISPKFSQWRVFNISSASFWEVSVWTKTYA